MHAYLNAGAAPRVAVLLVVVLLAACTRPTPYERATPRSPYGYSETVIDADTVRIEVSGNSQTPRQRVENQLLFRAAQLTLERGDDTFVFLDRDTERQVQQYWPRRATVGFPYYVGAYRPGLRRPYRPFRRRASPFAFYSPNFGYFPSSNNVYQVSRYTALAEVRFFKGAAPAALGPSYNAAEVAANLASQVGLPAGGPNQ